MTRENKCPCCHNGLLDLKETEKKILKNKLRTIVAFQKMEMMP